MQMRPILTAALFAMMPVAAQAGGVTGHTMMEHCTAKGGDAKFFCLGYMRATADAMTFWTETVGKDDAVRTCPDAVTAEQLRVVGVKFIKDNPKDRHLDATSLLSRAFMEAWPCKS
jgi:hypothetical protein